MEHQACSYPSQALNLNAEFVTVVHIHGMGRLMDQHHEAFGAKRLLPKAGLVNRQCEHVFGAPVGVEAAAGAMVAGELAGYLVLVHRAAVHELLAEPHSKIKAKLDVLYTALPFDQVDADRRKCVRRWRWKSHRNRPVQLCGAHRGAPPPGLRAHGP